MKTTVLLTEINLCYRTHTENRYKKGIISHFCPNRKNYFFKQQNESRMQPIREE